MFRKRRVSQHRLDGFQRLEFWVREAFGLQMADIVLVTEEKSRLPGYPEAETHVVFWKGEDRYRLRFFKPAEEVVRADLPPLWLLPTLLDDGNFECC
jgi:hypothetical protein